MSETETTQQQTTWARYRHRENPKYEYDVEVDEFGLPLVSSFKEQPCYRIHTIKNHFKEEETHQPAHTQMPTQHFDTVYQKVG